MHTHVYGCFDLNFETRVFLIFVFHLIGKKPRDLLNPKAVKYMQSIFSIKDTIGKKETREISALCGITVTQVIYCLMYLPYATFTIFSYVIFFNLFPLLIYVITVSIHSYGHVFNLIFLA